MTTFEMQITNDGENYDHSSKFEFPQNPMTTNFPIQMDRTIQNVLYNSYHVITTGGGIKTRQIVGNGTFHGSTRKTSYNGLAGKIVSNYIQRFWLDSDTFFRFYGGSVKEVLNSEKNNFIDYTFSLNMTDPYIYKNTSGTFRSLEVTGVSDSDPHVTGAFTNNGNCDTIPVIEITNNNATPVTQVDIGDGATLATSVHTFTWYGSSIANGKTLIIYPYKMLNQTGKGDVWSTRIGYCEIDDAVVGSRNQNGTGSQPRITAGTTSQVFSYQITGAVDVDIVFKWYDAYTG